MARGRKPALTENDIKFIRENPDNLSIRDLAKAVNVSLSTVLKARDGKGVYGRVA